MKLCLTFEINDARLAEEGMTGDEVRASIEEIRRTASDEAPDGIKVTLEVIE
jgi:hypothetical protein